MIIVIIILIIITAIIAEQNEKMPSAAVNITTQNVTDFKNFSFKLCSDLKS